MKEGICVYVKRLVWKPMYPLKGTLFIFTFTFYSNISVRVLSCTSCMPLWCTSVCACLMHECVCARIFLRLCMNLCVPVNLSWVSVSLFDSRNYLICLCAYAWIFVCLCTNISAPMHESLCACESELSECESVWFPTSKEGQSSNRTFTVLSIMALLSAINFRYIISLIHLCSVFHFP